ncbi:glyoxalase [Thalassotalea marina]|uniref:Glyoxalase n=1 Tax=Thalassotalea marina TaxID=1673741 RepID=A0A919BI09_9GAMM|nr:glyoxalase [Thalassotalea marina]
MIRLEHLNLVVRDISETLAFYQAAFPHWKVRGGEAATWYGVARNWVHFGDDYNYLTFNDQGQGENRDLTSNTLGLSHFAFVTSDIESLIERLKLAGFPPDKIGAENKYRKNVYYIDPNGYEIEFVEYLTDIPSQRNQYDNQQQTNTFRGNEREYRNPSWYF